MAGLARRSRDPVPSWYSDAMAKPSVRVTARRRELALDERGYRGWVVREEPVELQPATTALVLCDVWDHHWCRGAEERLEPLVPGIDHTARTARDLGMLVVHAPSDTMSFYADHPARARVLAAPPVAPPAERAHDDPPQPVDGSDSSDTARDPSPKSTRRWTRQHPGVSIDAERDAISDDGGALLGLYRQRGIDTVLIAGVHTNMCVLHRSFAIKQLVRWGIPVYLLRDLTDCMYNPARPPYVSHAAATEMTVHYIEQFWCPSITGAELCERAEG